MAHLAAEPVSINLFRTYHCSFKYHKQITGASHVLWTRFQERLLRPWGPRWANYHDVAHVQAEAIPMNLIWGESAPGISPVVAEFWHLQDSRSPDHAHGHAHYATLGKWPQRCTSTDQDGSNELDLEWTSPVVANFWCPKDSGALITPMGTPVNQAHMTRGIAI